MKIKFQENFSSKIEKALKFSKDVEFNREKKLDSLNFTKKLANCSQFRTSINFVVVNKKLREK